MKKIIAMLVCACVLLCSCGNSVGQATSGSNSDSAAADQQEPMASTLPSEMDADFPIEEWCDEDGVIDVERLLSDYEWNESYNYQVGINSETDGWYMVQPGNKDEIARGKSNPQITLRCDGDNGSSFSINNVRGLGNLDDLNVEWNARTKLEMMRTKNDDVVPKDLMRLLCVAMNTVKYGTDETSLVESFVDLTDEAELEGIKIGFYKLDFEKMIGVNYSGEEALTAAYQDASTDSGDSTDDSMEEAESGEGFPTPGGQGEYQNKVGDAVLYTENSIDKWTESGGLFKGKTFNVGQMLVDVWQMGGLENNVGYSFFGKDGSSRGLYFDDPDPNESNLYHTVTVVSINYDGDEFYTSVTMKDCPKSHSLHYVINGEERSINEELARAALVIAEEIARDPYRDNVLSGVDLGSNFEVH